MRINTGSKAIGHFGINIFKNLRLLYNKPKTNIALQVDNDNHIVTIKWLVKAIPNGITLNRLAISTNKNIVKIKGKNRNPSLPIWFFIIPNINSIILSKINCILEGINL